MHDFQTPKHLVLTWIYFSALFLWYFYLFICFCFSTEGEWEKTGSLLAWNSWTCAFIGSRCELECPPDGKTDCVSTFKVIGYLTAKLSRSEKNRKEEEEKEASWKIVGLTLWAHNSFLQLYWPHESSGKLDAHFSDLHIRYKIRSWSSRSLVSCFLL